MRVAELIRWLQSMPGELDVRITLNGVGCAPLAAVYMVCVSDIGAVNPDGSFAIDHGKEHRECELVAYPPASWANAEIAP